ncbi:MAG: BON domain-containing protein [Cyanobacteria bacterium SID2]|nr:BON domain-containing protein [Cyanobacteria bacterium SID2]MBP0002234.1 BON domain-containing protein [Cyanobacteria bacterium SBC]
MGWLNRIFGQEEEQKAYEFPPMPIKEAVERAGGTLAEAAMSAAGESEPSSEDAPIPPERVGLDGKYDQSGLAKRVVREFDRDPDTDDIETIWVAQLGSKVVLKGKAPSQADLEKLISIASQVEGATDVDTSEVEVG